MRASPLSTAEFSKAEKLNVALGRNDVIGRFPVSTTQPFSFFFLVASSHENLRGQPSDFLIIQQRLIIGMVRLCFGQGPGAGVNTEPISPAYLKRLANYVVRMVRLSQSNKLQPARGTGRQNLPFTENPQGCLPYFEHSHIKKALRCLNKAHHKMISTRNFISIG